tara:strand:- start:567 stop:1340 length:774 start_codon:yes stop_codon:yes gene_type:complete
MITAKLKGLDRDRFMKALNDMAAITGKPTEEIMRQQGRIIAEKLAWFTPRVGKTAKIGKQHMKDVRSTIDMVYISPLQMAKTVSKRAGLKDGKKWGNYARKRMIGKAQGMIDRLGITRGASGQRIEVGMFDGGNRHTRRLKGRKGTALVVLDYKSVTAYKKKKLAQVGALKAGWAAAARDLGGVGKLPKYITRKHKTRGFGKVKGKGGKVSVKISNRSNYIKKNREMSDFFNTQSDNMRKVIARMVKREAKKIANKV